MTRNLLILALGFGTVALAAQQSAAQSIQPTEIRSACAPRAKVLSKLHEEYGETRQSIGLGGESQVIEMFASTGTGTWTIVVTKLDGTSCIVAAGQAFENVAEALPAPGAPT